MRLSLLAVAAVLMLSGCNTYYQGTYEKILVRTPGVDNALCDLYTDNNRYTVMTARQVIVERTKQPLTVACSKTGYYPASVVVKPRVYDPKAPLNVLNGWVPGMAYDLASGSIYEYPETIIVTLLPMPPQELPPEPEPYALQLKPETVKPAPPPSAPPPSAADKSMSKSGQK
jgi:hypothetical protein